MRCLLALAVFLTATATYADVLTGPIRVIDGDTIDVGQTRVRIHGIDAVETAQECVTEQGVRWTCGHYVTDETRARYHGRDAICEIHGTDRYNRVIATCRVDGRDIGAALVADGLAFAYIEYSDAYLPLQISAEAADMGLWASSTQRPAIFRRGPEQVPPDAVCPIKGNISENGYIFHRPGDAFYGRTRINTDHGERWFCSEAEALDAGWRAARR